jgi:hypothetical protein
MEEGKSCGTGGGGDCGTGGSGCKCPCHKMPGILIALIGVTLLLGNLGILAAKVVGIIWPILLILLGLKKACKGACKCCSKESK